MARFQARLETTCDIWPRAVEVWWVYDTVAGRARFDDPPFLQWERSSGTFDFTAEARAKARADELNQDV